MKSMLEQFKACRIGKYFDPCKYYKYTFYHNKTHTSQRSPYINVFFLKLTYNSLQERDNYIEYKKIG